MNPHLTAAADAQFFAGTSLQSRFLGFGLRHSVHPMIGLWARLPFSFFPPNVLEHAARLLPAHEGTESRTVEFGDCTSEFLTAKNVIGIDGGDEQAILYFHGGAFFACGLNTHRRLVSRISYAAKQPVLNVGYCQMPNQSVEHAVADCLSGFTWLTQQGYRPENITLAGDSAGGFLAFAVAREAIDRGWGKPAGVVAISPYLDFDPVRRTSHRNAHRCQTFPMRAISRLSETAARVDQRRGSAPVISPVDMLLDDLPPTLIQAGSHEALLADAELMANRLVAAGVRCDLQVWDRQVHVFQAASWIPEARSAIAEVGDFVQRLSKASAKHSKRPAKSSARRFATHGRQSRAVASS